MLALKMRPETTGDYHVTFLSRHVMQIHVGNHYGMNMFSIKKYSCLWIKNLLGPNRKPNLKKYILWRYSVPLTYSICLIHESFNFDSRTDVIRPKKIVALSHWEFILTRCSTLSIVSPIIFTLKYTKSSKSHHMKA